MTVVAIDTDTLCLRWGEFWLKDRRGSFQKELSRRHDRYSIYVGVVIALSYNNGLSMRIFNRYKRRNLARSRVFREHLICNLQIKRSTILDRNEIDFLVVKLANVHLPAVITKLKIDSIFKSTSNIGHSVSGKIKPKAQIHDIFLGR